MTSPSLSPNKDTEWVRLVYTCTQPWHVIPEGLVSVTPDNVLLKCFFNSQGHRSPESPKETQVFLHIRYWPWKGTNMMKSLKDQNVLGICLKTISRNVRLQNKFPPKQARHPFFLWVFEIGLPVPTIYKNIVLIASKGKLDVSINCTERSSS